ncbi:hypothetical protein K435DRAFT_959532 [Dendrothele bispora CBS 962.96]|uniref:Chromatin modification-related protein n=1 Tax=Dendrothele bispora (strain CBS 962.96) TaxID=1314807 RepID=A0A4S8MXF8_DENBC|nr:hypothetical protein K435DRAFT_959532 [Dendrothele bispora CBS 962.96]
MSSGLRSRKRRHSQAFSEEQQVDQQSEPEQVDPQVAQTQKEREIWDAIREEQFEAVEQLPLHLHRQYALMRELDEQVQNHMASLLPTLMKYIAKRRQLHEETCKPHPSGGAPVDTTSEASSSGAMEPVVQAPAASTSGPSSSQRTSSTPMSIPLERTKVPETTMGMLSHIAWLSEESVHASQEKVYLAQAAQDSIDRQIRLIDQAIKEQEMAISLGVRPGTQLAPIILPEAVVPVSRWIKASSVPVFDDSDVEELEMPTPITALENVEPESISPPPPTIKTRRVRTKQPQEGPLTITLPAQKFCFCQQGSSGNMIACDNSKCKYEWFHWSCVGLKEAPPEEVAWYCPECQPTRKGKRSG